jgi:AcrR family transcriptional regulator
LDIARAALRLFQEKGYDATTAADIARAADFSERSFSRYCATKEDVVFFDIEGLLEEVRDAIGGVPPELLWDAVRDNVIGSVARFQKSGQEFASEVLRTWMTDPALAGPFQRFCQRWQVVLAEGWCTAHGGTDPDADIDAQLVAHYVVSTCQACFRVYALTGRELQPLLEHGFARLQEGLTPTTRGSELSASGRGTG